MRTFIAVMIASVLFASAASAALPAMQAPPRRTGPLILPITQLRTMFPASGRPIVIIKSGVESAEGTGTSAPTTSTTSAPTNTGTAANEGDPAYKTGSGVALTPASMSNAATSSQLSLYYCILTADGVSKTQDGGVQCHFPTSIAQSLSSPIASALFGHLPKSPHMYLLTLNALVGSGSLADNISVKLCGQQLSASDLKVNGETLGVVFTYDATFTPLSPGSLAVDIGWTGRNFTQGPNADLLFYSMQLVQLD